MKRVITYGTFDLLHQGHINILKRAKALGDYLVVGVTSENYDVSRGKLNVQQSLIERIENVKSTGLADLIIVEEYLGQKVGDIKKHNIDTFVIGSDWEGKFDYLKPFCEVVYLERTKGISSTDLRNSKNSILKIGVVGNGRIAKRFVKEAKFVSGIAVDYVYGRNEEHLKEFAKTFALNGWDTDYNKFLEKVDAVYIALPHTKHYEYAKNALLAKKHVLCEKPIVLKKDEAQELFNLAENNNLVLQEGIKTAYCPCFDKLINVVQSGLIGDIKDIDATFTKIISDKTLREYNPALGGGSLNELGSYPLLVISKLLGHNPESIDFISYYDSEISVDTYTKVVLKYKNAIATANVGIGVKKEGSCVISGTKGYIYIPAPWWKTEYFEARFEDLNQTQKFFTSFDGDGLRYEISDFLTSINTKKKSHKLSKEDSIFIASVLDEYRNKGIFKKEMREDAK